MSKKSLQPLLFLAAAALSAVGMANSACAQDAPKMKVAEVPLFDGAADVSFMKRRGDVRYQAGKDFRTVGEYYAKTLTQQKWRKSKRDNLQKSFWVQTFSKGGATLEVRVAKRGNGSDVRLTPKGMMWAEDDQPTPKDLPYPEDAKAFEYNDFSGSIEYLSGSDVKSLAKFLETELVKRKWTKVATPFDHDNFVRMKFTFDKSSIDVDVRAEDEGSEVTIRTKGMQWDGMKAEIARAEKEAKKLAAARERMEAEEEKKRQAAAMLAARERRKNKPKTGIAQLPKLPNEATIVMDGERFELKHVVAFEVFQYGELTTRIVATNKPIKQSTLIERLKKVGTEEYEEALSFSLPNPHLMVVLGEDDEPQRLNLRAGGTPGHGSGDELKGKALVEDGRVRGSVELAEPGEFFDKVYTAKVSFDVSILTKDSEATKRLTDAPKLANAGKLTIGSKTYQLKHVVAYDLMYFDEPRTAVVLTEKPLNMRNLSAALGRKAADEYFEFTPQVKLLIDEDDNIKSVSIWADNTSLGGNSELEENVVVEDGRVRGVAKMKQPQKFFDTHYTFEASFDLNKLGQRPSNRNNKPTGGLQADSYKGLPVPEGHDGLQSEGSLFRTEATTSVKGKVLSVVEFYRGELASGDWGEWQEDGASQTSAASAKLIFSGAAGGLTVLLKANGDKVDITLVSRDAQAAKAKGLLPATGKARLFIANESSRANKITINGSEYTVAAGAGARDPKTGINWEIGPGSYTIKVNRGGRVQSEKLKIEAGTTMGIIIDRSGGFQVIELY